MEYEKFKQYEVLFYFGIFFLVLSLGLVIFGLYILPFLLWDTNYGVPYFVSDFISYYHDNYDYSYAMAKTVVDMWFLIPGIIAGIISYFISHYIDNQVYIEKPVESEEDSINRKQVLKKEIKESANLGLRIFVLIIIVIAAILLLQSIFFGK